MTGPEPGPGHVTCHHCGQQHHAEPSHVGGYDRKVWVFAAVCPVDQLTDYYTEDVVTPGPT